MACVLGIAFSACTKEFTYEPAQAEPSDKMYVSWKLDGQRSFEAQNGEYVNVTLTRNATEGSLSVPVQILDDPSGLFSLAESTATFADGEATAVAKIAYDYEKLDPKATYKIEVFITDESLVSQYGALSMPLQLVKAWRNLGKAQFFDNWFFGVISEKTLLQSPDGSPVYRLMEPFSKAEIEEAGFEYVSDFPYLEFTIAGDGSVSYEELLPLGFNFNGKACYFADPLWLQNDSESKAANALLMDGLVQFMWYPIMNFNATTGGFSWWGTTSGALISFPGGPDLNELLQ